MHHLWKAVLGVVVLGGSLSLVGCGEPESTIPTSVSVDPAKVGAAAKVQLCGSCGHQTGSEACCSDSCPKCEDCGLHEGSPLCCAVGDELRGKDMCATCGHVANSEECCSDDCETCGECGMHHGSPLCCKLESGEEHTHADGEHSHADDAAESKGTEEAAEESGESDS